MAETKYDIAVIGSGPGGYTAAIRAAQLGKKVAIIEKGDIGGTCLNRGCIPTKTLHESAKFFSRIGKAEQFGITVENPSVSLSAIIDRKNRIVNQLRKGLEFLFKENKIDLLRGEGTLINGNHINFNGQALHASKIILATGSSVSEMPPFTIDEKQILSSDGILDLRQLPEKLGIVGAGPMGIELACVFSGLGSKVTVFEMMPTILPKEDAEISKALHQSLVKQGIEIRTGTSLKDVDEFDAVLISIGRKMNTQGFEQAGIKLNGGKVSVNERMQTNLPTVYAIGDIAGKYMFAHTAAAEGIVAAENACGKRAKMEYHAIPRCIYSDPGVASVGITEDEAVALYGADGIKIGRYPFRAASKSLINDERDGLIKIVCHKDGKILGVHILGGLATEILGEGALAVSKGLKAQDIMSTIHAHPTVYESLGEAAANALKQAISIINK